MGIGLSIDETMLNGELYTIVANKDGRCGKGSMVAMVKGTRTADVVRVLMKLPEDKRGLVAEVSMDFSDSMRAAAVSAFPNAACVLDCFHIIKLFSDATEEIRLKAKREAVRERRKAGTEHKRKLAERRKRRTQYRKSHPKEYKGRKRGRKPSRLNGRFVPETFPNGDTKIELLTRSRGLMMQSGEKWSVSQKERARLLFGECPRLKEAHGLLCSLRSIFRDHSLDKEQAREKLHEWYAKVAACSMRELKSVRDTLKSREEDILNYFHKFTTNAYAESLNSKIKAFLAQLHGVTDMEFFMYRLSCIFG